MATTTPSACLPRVDAVLEPPDVEIVVPVHDEERDLEPSVRRLHAYLTDRFPLSWVVTIADNASHDRTWPIACRLASTLERVRAVHVDEKGRGRALRATWTASDARVVAYMDVDLSTDLDALLPLVASVSSGHSDVAVGSRLVHGAHVQRGPRRELLSRAYNLLLHVATRTPVADAQCGFKAVRTDVAHALLPLVEDDAWFFDTELLLLAEHNGLRVHEVPVDWVDDADSRVAVVPTALGDVRGVVRVLARFARGEGALPTDAPLGALASDRCARHAPARRSRLRYAARLGPARGPARGDRVRGLRPRLRARGGRPMTTTAAPGTWSPPPEPTPAAPKRTERADPAWVRPALVALLLTTAVLYLWGLGASGWANTFYSAAVQAGTKSWKAFFFGSSDAANFITVDKSPLFLWPMELSARVFGLSSWSILVPQAIEGTLAVGVLYAAVRRWSTPFAGLLAGAVLAVTPVAALMFRYNNPDALLTLLLTLAAYATVRAIENGRTRWVALVGVCVGFAFLAKMLQALLVVPGFGLAYLVAAPGTVWRRVRQLAIATVALVVSAGWWVAAVALTPASMRPYVGGSTNNSIFDLIFGYNGFGRLSGNETGSVGGLGNAAGRWGPTGLGRLFNAQFGGQASWLLPAALIFLAAGVVYRWRRARTDRTRASIVVWGGWLLVTGGAISFGQGIIHPYYTVALAPAVGALVGIGVATAWQRRNHVAARALLAGALATTALWAGALLHRTPTWHPALRTLVLVAGIGVAALLLAWPALPRHARGVVASLAVVAALAAPIAYTLETVSTTRAGAIPSAGPATSAGFGPGGAFRGNGGNRAFGNRAFGPGRGFPGGFGPGAGGASPGGGLGRAPGGLGGLLDGSTVSDEARTVLQQDAHRFTWVAAAVGSNRASGYQLATGEPVMAIGGFNGTDPAPTLAQFEQYVRDGKIHYYVGGGGFGGGRFGGGGGPGGPASDSASAIGAWVEQNFTARTVGGVTLYDLTSPTSSSPANALTG